ncbi:MAG TPA: efflux RND transporter periplasmic adaptor subunit [Candidatus Acidoferrales bacterium]|nr:efflux RND transporter periplasmic adaptor subunit [Candidatus Acidoferrales bacterium]
MISTETKEQEVQNITEKDRAASPKLTGSRATPGPTLRKLSRAWLYLAGGILAVTVVLVLLPPTVQVTKPITMTIYDEAVGVGYVQAKVPVSASAKINGVIHKVYVDQGDSVKKGQVLAQLENEDYRSQVTQAESQVQAAEAALSSARAEHLAAEARARAGRSAISRSRAGLNLAKVNYDRAKGLYDSAVWSKQALDDAETTYVQAQEDLKNSEETQRSLDQGVAAADAGVKAAQQFVSAAQAGVGFQHASLQYTIVTSPMDGYVVSRDLEEGSTVVPGESIFTLAGSKVVWVTAYIDEKEINGLRPGQPAQIVLRSRSHQKIAGFVARVGQQADPVTEELQVDVSFAKPDPTVRLQETAEVYIQKAEHLEAKVLPVSAVIPGTQGASVWVVDNHHLERRAVSVDIVDKRGYAEILNGISPSDFVVIHPEAYGQALLPGKRVRTKFAPSSAGENR